MTSIHETARNQAISLEAKKDALSQRQSGDWKVSFTVQGIDMDPRLTKAAMGTRFAMVLVEIGDDELPRQQPAKENKTIVAHDEPQATSGQVDDKPPVRTKRDWRELQPAQQAGIRCAEPTFVAYLKEQHPKEWRETGEAAECIRFMCSVHSRVELGTNQKARALWHTIDTDYQAWLAKERVGA